MPWQDWVFSVGGFLFMVSLVPTIRGDQKPALTTSLMTTVLVSAFAVTMASLDLWLSAVANAGSAIAWGILAVQRYEMTKRSKHEGILAQVEDEVGVTLGTEESSPVTDEGAEPERNVQTA